jgi:hypothetical protein
MSSFRTNGTKENFPMYPWVIPANFVLPQTQPVEAHKKEKKKMSDHQMEKLVKSFVKKFNYKSATDSSSDSEESEKDPQMMRPAVLHKSSITETFAPGEMTLVDLTIQNQTKKSCPISSVQKTGGSDQFHFEPL